MPRPGVSFPEIQLKLIPQECLFVPKAENSGQIRIFPVLLFVFSEKSCIFAGEKNVIPFQLEVMNSQMINRLSRYFATQPVTKAWVFGSVARGEETPDSDIDLMVALDENQIVGLKFFGMYEDLRQITGRNVDLVTENSLMPFARESAHKDRRLIYERTH